MRLFFSHSSRDKALLREIKSYFPSWLSAWLDEEKLIFGSDLSLSLQNAINADVDYVVLFLGEEAVNSEWVKREIEWALAREEEVDRVFLLPILLADVRDKLHNLGLSDRLTLQIADFTKESTRNLAEKIVGHIAAWLSERLTAKEQSNPIPPQGNNYSNLVGTLASNLNSTPIEWQDHVETILLRPFLHQSTQSRRGEIPLTASQYYQSILREIRTANAETSILAVSTLSSSLWNENISQIDYAARNIEAVERGTMIRRLFVLPESGEEQFREMIFAQSDSGIDVRVANGKLLAHVSDLEDLVLFEDESGLRGYVSHPSIDGKNRIRSGKLIVAPELTDRMRMAFSDGWDMAVNHSDFFRAISAKLGLVNPLGPPGLTLEAKSLTYPVVTCEEAASAKGIPVEAELKSLIIETSNGLVVAHLPGDGILSLAKVKKYLESEQAYLADPETLLRMGLSAGTVSALIDPVWNMPHLISRRVFDLTEMSTNNGTKTGYFLFDPAILTQAPNIRVGEFEKHREAVNGLTKGSKGRSLRSRP